MGLAGVICAAAFAQEPAPPDSVLRLIDLAGLARLEPGAVCRQFASTDPAGRGDDHGHFLRMEGRRAVLAEMDGPGVIVRLWSANAAGRLRLFFDGESEARLDAPFQDLFTGKCPPFVEPIATHQGGGWISYFPIPYARHCKVEVDELENPAALYYQVQYLTWPAGTPIRTFTRELPPAEKRALERVLESWRAPPQDPPRALEGDLDAEWRGAFDFTKTAGGMQGIAPGERVELARVEDPAKRGGVVGHFSVRVPRGSPEELRGLVLEVEQDGASAPLVSAPVADFFGVGFGMRDQRGLLLGWRGDAGWCRFPLPFRERLGIFVLNAGLERPLLVECKATFGRFARAAPDDLGRFHAEFRAVDPVGEELYEFARIAGAGKLAGVNFTLQGVGDLWYLEGNEQISVDGESRPSIVGTGTEDFFNGGWYWDSGPLSLPLHGLGVKEEWTTNRTTPWRHFLPDAVPFRSGLVGRIEHGSANAVLDACYASVAFWYGESPTPVRRVTPQEARLPRQWVKRPKDALAAATLNWSPEGAMKPAKWEDLSRGFRGCEFPLYQGFPVSHFERDRPKVPAEVALLRGREVRAAFMVDEGDRYRLRLQLVRHPGAPKLAVLVDDQPAGEFLPAPGGGASGGASTSSEPADGVAPELTPQVGPVGLARGEHVLALRQDPAAPPDAWTGLDCLVLESAAPFVKSWWIAPPLECDPRGTVEQAPEVEAAFIATGFDPAAAGWKEVADAGDVADLNHWVTPRAPIFAYLATWVRSPDDRVARVRLGSDDGVRVWANGELAWSHALHRPITVDADRFDLKLRAGWNLLLVKVRNDDGGFALSLRLADPDGALLASTRRG
jgi:hypothetical protein